MWALCPGNTPFPPPPPPTLRWHHTRDLVSKGQTHIYSHLQSGRVISSFLRPLEEILLSFELRRKQSAHGGSPLQSEAGTLPRAGHQSPTAAWAAGPCKHTHSVPAGRLHDLTQPDAHALPLITLLRPQAFLEDGDDLREDLLPELPDQVPQCPCCDLSAEGGSAHQVSADSRAPRRAPE